MPIKHTPIKLRERPKLTNEDITKYYEEQSHILGRISRQNERALSETMHNLRKATQSQAAKFLPMMETTFSHLMPLIPNSILKRVMEIKELNNVRELQLDAFRRTIFVSRPVFNEVRNKFPELKNAGAFYHEGYTMIPVDKGRFGEIVVFPIVHEWVHHFDRATRKERTITCEEGLAYGVSMFLQRKIANISILKQEVSTEHPNEYKLGFYLGKNIASAAIELQSRKGDNAVKTLFHRLFEIHDFDAERVLKIKDELLKA